MDVTARACVRSVMSVTTSVGDLHKAPFQSCSVRRRRAQRGAAVGEGRRGWMIGHEQTERRAGGLNEGD